MSSDLMIACQVLGSNPRHDTYFLMYFLTLTQLARLFLGKSHDHSKAWKVVGVFFWCLGRFGRQKQKKKPGLAWLCSWTLRWQSRRFGMPRSFMSRRSRAPCTCKTSYTSSWSGQLHHAAVSCSHVSNTAPTHAECSCPRLICRLAQPAVCSILHSTGTAYLGENLQTNLTC